MCYEYYFERRKRAQDTLEKKSKEQVDALIEQIKSATTVREPAAETAPTANSEKQTA